MRFRALVRKELLEAFRSFFWEQKTGKRRKPSGLIMFGVLYVLILFNLIRMYSGFLGSIAASWLSHGYSDAYFAFAIIISSVLSLFLSVIIIYSSLFMSKDNSVMLSLPIRPYEILLSRLCSIYLFTFVFTALGLIPAFVIYAKNAPVTFISAVTFGLCLFLLPAVVLSISTLFGYLIGLVTARMRHKQAGIMIITAIGVMFISFGFGTISGSAASGLLEGSVPTSFLSVLKGSVNPLGLAGRAFAGSVSSLIFFLVISLVFICAVTVLVGRSLVRILGITEKQKKVKFKAEMIRSNSIKKALFERERRKVFSNAIYVMNCMLGSIMALIGAVALLIFSGKIRAVLSGFTVPVSIISGALCAMASMNDITAPSVSTEGNSIWILRSLPVRTEEILNSKIRFHFIYTFVPFLLLQISVSVTFPLSIVQAIISLAVMALYILVVAFLGLFNDLKHGDTSYINEAVAIKQSMSVLFSLGEAMVLAALILVPSIVFMGRINGYLLTGIYGFVLCVLFILLFSWMKRKGKELFCTL